MGTQCCPVSSCRTRWIQDASQLLQGSEDEPRDGLAEEQACFWGQPKPHGQRDCWLERSHQAVLSIPSTCSPSGLHSTDVSFHFCIIDVPSTGSFQLAFECT